LADARAILRRAGVDVARVLYRDDRAKAVDLVVSQSDVRSSTATSFAVALTAIARAAVVIRHKPEDADVARGLLGALTSSPSTAGIAFRMTESSTIREEAASRVTYSQRDLAATAADIAKEATVWLRKNQPDRAALAATVYPPVVARTIIIGLPDRGGTSSSSSAKLPDVRGLLLGPARRMLTAAGVNAVAYKWSDDRSRKPLEVFDQSEITGAAGRTVVLQVGAKGTLWVYHSVEDAPIALRFARDLQSNMNMYGILVRLEGQRTVRAEIVGKVTSVGTLLSREARTIATFTSNWFGREVGRTISIEVVTEPAGPSRLTFGFPSPR
jgi:hypothetical protein